jgi:hypothetical protein
MEGERWHASARFERAKVLQNDTLRGDKMNALSKLGHTWLQISGACSLLTLLTILAACGCSNDLTFDDVLQSECSPPCWRDIVPGVTARGKVVELLGREPEVEDLSLPVWRWGSRCIKGGDVSQVRIGFDQSDTVVSITLAEAEPRITFADIVREHGAPTAVMINECSPESDLGYIYLVYHEDGVAFASGSVPVLDQPWQTPSAKERVYRWSYFEPTSPDRMLLQDGILPCCGLRFYSYSSEWSGFGP